MPKHSSFVHWITVVGAREHNLKNISVAIPKDALTVITGPSGSGKSSLALDILFTEGKRRYLESLSSYARQFLGIAKKPDVDRIDGLCPSIAIEQKTVGSNPRSTVGTITEVYDYLRILYARIGVIHCPQCYKPVQAESAQTITQLLMRNFIATEVTIAAPLVNGRKGEFTNDLMRLFNAGLYRFLIDGVRYTFQSIQDIKAVQLKKQYVHSIDILIDALLITPEEQSRLNEAVETAFKYAHGACAVIIGDEKHVYSSHMTCVSCSLSMPEREPRLFSFNSPLGACPACHGLGTVSRMAFSHGSERQSEHRYPGGMIHDGYSLQELPCRACNGKRLKKEALSILIKGIDIYSLSDYSIKNLLHFFKNIVLDETETEIAQTILEEIMNRLLFLCDVGLDYLTLNRSSSTISGGEGQRIRLATQIGSGLSGVLYILDEPSIGLHQRDNDRLIATLKKLRDQGNTLVVVEHDMDTIAASDYVIDMGPAAGILGGTVTACGTPDELAKNPASLTGSYLSGKRAIRIPEKVRIPRMFMTLTGVSKNNLKNITVQFPLAVLCGISGVSGSGKSSLIMQELVPLLLHQLQGFSRKRKNLPQEGSEALTGAETIQNLVVIDQAPIGRTPRSNPATYLGIFDAIRALFAAVPESNARGYGVGRFSFNVSEGRCALCKGEGTITVEMHFLPDVIIMCKACKGKRYNDDTLSILYKGKSIADVLSMSALEARDFFSSHTAVVKRIALLCDVGLDYILLGQPSTTLSGGEAQRIKLVDELSKRGMHTLYILDEPTTGLHASDIEKLLQVLNRLVDKGNSMIVIEHNLDVLKTVDYLIDLGPEGGELGGEIVAQGTPRDVTHVEKSYTGFYLRSVLSSAQ